MGLVVNHNMMAMAAARNLSTIYGRLAVSTARLSSGLRINSAADDAAGLAVRESMRADIAVLNQGVRNAGDAISLIQTAEGALSVVDEKLIRMKELAEQAATGTYTTAQRAIMDSEYQQMASEIDRIATATDFNGVALLDGSLEVLNDAKGLKIHFGTGNSSAEDYYYINIGNLTATTGMGVGGTQDQADIWKIGTGLCAAGCVVGDLNDEIFAFQYDKDADGAYQLDEWAGFYGVTSTTTLTQLNNLINEGAAARIMLNIAGACTGLSIHIGDETYFAVSTAGSAGWCGGVYNIFQGANETAFATSLAAAVNGEGTGFWAVQSGTYLAIYDRGPGLAGNTTEIWTIGETAGSVLFGSGFSGAATVTQSATTLDRHLHFAHGAETWATATVENADGVGYRLTLTGGDPGSNYDISFAYSTSIGDTANDLILGNSGKTGLNDYDAVSDSEWISFQDAIDGNPGGGIATQTNAQTALAAIDSAIATKDNTRAYLGGLQNRLENTITNLTVQAENLQAAESRVSDVDVALEMTEFTKNNILVQAAVAMLAQANTLPTLALTLLGGV